MISRRASFSLYGQCHAFSNKSPIELSLVLYRMEFKADQGRCDVAIHDDKGTENDTLTLMELPDCVLLQILSYLDLDFLRHVASMVSTAFRWLSHSKILWSHAVLSYESQDCWDDTPGQVFVRDLLATPYLHRLSVESSSPHESNVLAALVATQCKLHSLMLKVDKFIPEWLLMLQQHPEIEELELADDAEDDAVAAQIATTLGIMIPRLTCLNISGSKLLQMPVAGQILSTISSEGNAGRNAKRDLDVTDVDNEVYRLQRLVFEPPHIAPSALATAAKNTTSLILANRHSLRDVQIDLPHLQVFLALAECTRLEKLSVKCDEAGANVRAMLEAMAHTGLQTIHTLRLRMPTALGGKGLADLVQTLCQLEARVEVLELAGEYGSGGPWMAFPGFGAFSSLLADSSSCRRGSDQPGLRVLRISELCPIGRTELLELARMARVTSASQSRPTASGLSLRRLELTDCPCSHDRLYEDCRDRADDELQRLVPNLELNVFSTFLGVNRDDRYDVGFMALNTCDCNRRAPQGRQRGWQGSSRRPRRQY